MRKMLVLWAVFIAGAVSARAQVDAQIDAQVDAQPANDVWGQLIPANDLDVAGKTPFHLTIGFQVYGLDGKPSEKGSVEEWWAAPGSQKVVIHLDGLDENGRVPEGASPTLVRDAFLAHELLRDVVHLVPLEPMVLPGVELGEWEPKGAAKRGKKGATDASNSRPVKFGNVTLDCVAPNAGGVKLRNVSPATFCVVPTTEEVMIYQSPGAQKTVVRSRAGSFRDTYVGIDLRVDYLGKAAISGTLTTLQAFDPAKSDVKLSETKASGTFETKTAAIGGEVVKGNRVKFVEPMYPEIAKREHATGTVFLNALIGIDGRIRRLVPIASSDPMFTGAAVDAVKQWVYRPYLLKGVPTEVDTTITVNFALNPN